MSQQSSPSDSVRYAHKLWLYLPPLETISKALQTLKEQKLADEPGFHKISQEVLYGLKRASDSEIAFYADNEGHIHFSDPEDSGLVDKTFPSTKRVKKLLEDGEPLVIEGDTEDYPELKILGVQSLLVVRLRAPWGAYFLGVCNGRGTPAYEGVDKKLFQTLAGILESGIQYGHTLQETQREQREQTETQLAYERYLDAQLRGEYNFLFRDGGDYARRLLKLQNDTAKVQIDTLFNADEVYADYLEAALSMVIRDEPESEKVTRGTAISDEAEESKLSFLLSCMESFEQLPPQQYPQTALARARIYLWAYIKVRTRVAHWPDEQKQNVDFQQKDLDELKVADCFYTSFRELLKEVETEKTWVEELPPLPYDWLKTLPREAE